MPFRGVNKAVLLGSGECDLALCPVSAQDREVGPQGLLEQHHRENQRLLGPESKVTGGQGHWRARSLAGRPEL